MRQWYQCPSCGAAVAFGVRFCGNCGMQLAWPEQQQIQKSNQVVSPLGWNNNSISGQMHMDIAGLIGKAMVLINEGKSDEALQYIDKALKVNQNHSIAWSIKGEALYRLGRLQEAIECYDKAISLDLFSSEARFGRGLTYSELGNYECALMDFEFHRSRFPDGLVVRYFEGIAHSNLGHYKQAMKIFDQAIKLICKSESEAKKRVHDERFIFDISKFKSWSALMWTGKGRTLIKMGQLKEALICLKKAVSVNPDSVTWQNLGSLYHSLGRYQDAKKCNDKALEIGQNTTGRLNLYQYAWLKYVGLPSEDQ